MKDDWKDIEGFDGAYQVNSEGQVRSRKSFSGMLRNSGSIAKDFRVLKPGKRRGGSNRMYLFYSLRKNGVVHYKSAHRLVASAYLPNPENLPEVNHIDGDKLNNNASNLEWCSRQYNIDHYNQELRVFKGYGTIRRRDSETRYACFISVLGTRVRLGTYKSRQESRAVFSEAYREFWGKPPRLESLN